MSSIEVRSTDRTLPFRSVVSAVLYRLRTAALPPKSFPNTDSEAAFVRRYQQDGMLAYSIALVIGGVALLIFFVAHAIEGVTYGSNRVPPQALRLIVAATLLLLAYLLLSNRSWFYAHFDRIGLVGPVLAILGVALLPFTMYSSAATPGFPFARFFLSLATTIWICFAFSRANRVVILITSLSASLALVSFGVYHDFEGAYFSSLHLAVAIWAGWALSILIEKRERQVFVSQERMTIESQAMAENLERADIVNEIQTNALQTIAHDIRQPLLSLGLYADLVGSKYGDEPTLKDLADRIQSCLKASENSLVVVENVLQSAGEAACFGLRETTLTRTITMLDVVFTPILASQGVRLELPDPSDQLTKVWTNEHALSEILLNLITNAYKHAWPQPFSASKQVSLQIQTLANRTVVITVGDNGCGIDAAFLTRIFEKGFRTDETEDSRGHGLGLSIVRGLVDKLPGHQVTVESTLGQGTWFRLQVPSSDPDPHADT